MNCCSQWHGKVNKNPLSAGLWMLAVGLDSCCKTPFTTGFYVLRPSLQLQCYLKSTIFLSSQIAVLKMQIYLSRSYSIQLIAFCLRSVGSPQHDKTQIPLSGNGWVRKSISKCDQTLQAYSYSRLFLFSSCFFFSSKHCQKEAMI